MSFPPSGSSSFQQPRSFFDSQFDIFEWYPYFQSCVRYFLDHAQYENPVQALAALINIRLPFQWFPHPVTSSAGSFGGKMPMGATHPMHHAMQQAAASVTLQPFLRRLVATGCDNAAVLHGFFGDDWSAGIGWLHEQERQNYLFAAKSDSWLHVKGAYDMADGQTIPFLRPLQNVSEKEIEGAESTWSEWLATQDWMLGPRAPGPAGEPAMAGSASSRGRLRRPVESDHRRHHGASSHEAGPSGQGGVRPKRESS